MAPANSLEEELEQAAAAVMAHVAAEGAHALASLLGVAQRALVEAAAVRSLLPPPVIGADELNSHLEALDDLRARDEVHRKQIGALIFEKGRLNAEIARLKRRLDEAAEEKARTVHALGEALQRTTLERDERRRSSNDAMLEQMVASQRRTIDGLRKELRAARQAHGCEENQQGHGSIPAADARTEPPQTPQTPMTRPPSKRPEPHAPSPDHHELWATTGREDALLLPADAPQTLACASESAAHQTFDAGAEPKPEPPSPAARLGASPAGRPLLRGATDTKVLVSGRRRGSSSQLEMTYEQLQLSLLHLRTDHSSMALQLARTSKEKSQAQKETEDLRVQIRQLEREIDTHRREAEALYERLHAQAAQLEEARSDLVAANAALAQAARVVPPAGGAPRVPGSSEDSEHVALDLRGERAAPSSAAAAGSRLAAASGFASGRRRVPGRRIWRMPLRWALWAIGAGGEAVRLQPRQRAIGGDPARSADDRHALMSV
jgi:peptidoglycan hydrolase CwlO-like protein